MSRRFLTPVNLPHGATLPAAGSAGDLFYKTTDNKVYTHNGTAWTAIQGSGGGASALSDLTDTTITTPVGGQTLLYDEATSKWLNISFAEILASFGLITGDGGLYNTTEFAGTIDGGSYNSTLFMSVVDGGNEGSF